MCSQFELLQHIEQFKKLAIKSRGAPKISSTSCRLLKYCTLVQFLQYFTQIINIAINFILLHYTSDNAITAFLHLLLLATFQIKIINKNSCSQLNQRSVFTYFPLKELLKPPKGTTLQCNSSITLQCNSSKIKTMKRD